MFPETARVRYEKCPLVEVVCQIRFPTVLAINEGEPTRFQEKVRSDYPRYSVAYEPTSLIDIEVGEGGEFLPRVSQVGQSKNFAFVSADGTWKVNLTDSYMALSSACYTIWEGFRNRLEKVLESLHESYDIGFYTRLGLRYIDVFDRAALSVGDAPWASLLRPDVLGMLSSDMASRGRLLTQAQRTDVLLDDGESVITVNGMLGRNDVDGNSVFVMDTDSYLERPTVSLDESLPKLDYLHRCSSGFLRWAITDELHQAMRPMALEVSVDAS